MTYNVLWFDDECETLELIKDDALAHGIILTGFNNAKDGLIELEKSIEFFDAVIVDGKFFENEEQTGDTVSDRAFVTVARALDKLENRKKIPWFILSGQASFTKESNPYAQAFKDNKVYDKYNDDHFLDLWTEIKNQASKQEDTQIRHKHARAFEVCAEKYIGSDASKDLLAILKKENSINDFSSTDLYFNAVRKIVEDLFKAFNKYGLLPDDFVAGSISLNEASKFLSGNKEKGYQIVNNSFPGKIIANSLRNILTISQPASHRGDVDSFLKKVQSPYLLYSITYDLLNVLIWFKAFVDENSDKQSNTKFWKKSESIFDYIEGELQYDGKNYHVADCIILKNKIEGIYKIGEKIRITKFSENTNERSKQFLFFANTIIKVD